MIVGIDLGTTNSLVSVWQDGASRVIPNALGHSLTPSVVGVDDKGAVLVGLAARERLLTHPELTASVFKRYMGTTRTARLASQDYRPEELSSLVLLSLKADAEAALGTTVEEAVITVPAYFSDAQRKATRIAGQLAGLKVDRLLNEPTAAALAYGLQDTHGESKFLVFDLGGGTFDVSVLELFEGVMEVRASAGDNFLGGEDFASVLAQEFASRADLHLDFLTRKERAALREQAERAKRQLSSEQQATIRLQARGSEHNLDISVERFEALSEPLLARLRAPIERALRDARIRAAELDRVVLAGGATRMPMIRKLVARMFGQIPSANLNPDEVVAIGAGVQAGLKARDAALNELVLTDVSPYSLGIQVSDRISPGHTEHGVFAPILERNTVIPASRSKSFCTMRDNQTEILVRIFQGEARMVQDNILLGEIRVPVAPKRAGAEAIDVRFTYDVNGLLEVEAMVLSTKRSSRLLIESNHGVLTQKEIAERLVKLATLKIHPREQAENRALLERAERIFQESLGERREYVGALIGRFAAVLDDQDPRACAEARVELAGVLDQLEGQTYL